LGSCYKYTTYEILLYFEAMSLKEQPTPDTDKQWHAVVHKARTVFETKARDYGASWSIMRPSSITDQIFIKARRIRSIEEKNENKVGDSIESEYVGIVNYCHIALILLEPAYQAEFAAANYQPSLPRLLELYDKQTERTYNTLVAKNHDYGEAWRDMRMHSFTDMLLTRLMRIKQIEDNQGTTLASEGVDANYIDMINYAAFALIKIDEARNAA
jgi:hypothetical protein